MEWKTKVRDDVWNGRFGGERRVDGRQAMELEEAIGVRIVGYGREGATMRGERNTLVGEFEVQRRIES